MPRSVGTVLNNNLSKGLVTEATGLNFPDNAVAEAWNVSFERIGCATRRGGIDIETGAQSVNIPTSNGAIREYVWQAAALDGSFTFLVLQVGWYVYFFQPTSTIAITDGLKEAVLDLRDYAAPGASDIEKTGASFAAGAGYLFVTHPTCEPLLIRYDSADDVFEVAAITIQIRDFEGVPDNLAVEENPYQLYKEHWYNLKNQGWYKNVRVGDSSNEIIFGPGFTTNIVNYSLNWQEL